MFVLEYCDAPIVPSIRELERELFATKAEAEARIVEIGRAWALTAGYDCSFTTAEELWVTLRDFENLVYPTLDFVIFEVEPLDAAMRSGQKYKADYTYIASLSSASPEDSK